MTSAKPHPEGSACAWPKERSVAPPSFSVASGDAQPGGPEAGFKSTKAANAPPQYELSDGWITTESPPDTQREPGHSAIAFLFCGCRADFANCPALGKRRALHWPRLEAHGRSHHFMAGGETAFPQGVQERERVTPGCIQVCAFAAYVRELKRKDLIGGRRWIFGKLARLVDDLYGQISVPRHAVRSRGKRVGTPEPYRYTEKLARQHLTGQSSSESAPNSSYSVQQATPKPKAFIPPKIVSAKKAGGKGKRPLPKRTPFPGTAVASVEAAKDESSGRKADLALLQSSLQKSRASIGQRWQEAWKSADSSMLSGESDLDELGSLSSSALHSSLSSSRDSKHPLGESEGGEVPRSLTTSGDRRDIMQLLEKEVSESVASMPESTKGSLNLTASDFIADLKADFAQDDSSYLQAAVPIGSSIPRPFQQMKLNLFQGGERAGGSPSPLSTESSAASFVGARLPSRETSAPGEFDEDLGLSEEEDREALLARERKSRDMRTASGRKAFQAAGEAGYSEAEEEVQEPRRKTVVVKRPLKPSDMAVEARLEEDACLEDFDRREMTDRIIYEYTTDPLTPQLEKLRDERVRLAEWAKRVGAQRLAAGAEGQERTTAIRPPLVRHPPPQTDLAGTFPATDAEYPLNVDFSPRGEGIEQRMLQRALLPSTKVWQLEQRNKRLQRQTAKQREHLILLQAALRKKAAAEHPATSASEKRTDSFGAKEGDHLPLQSRTLELQMYEQQCVYLGAQLDEEHDFARAYKEQLDKTLFKNIALKKRHANAVAAIKHHKALQEQHAAAQAHNEEAIADLQDRMENEAHKRLLEVSCRQQREEQASALQQRYAQLLHYLEEAEEKRSAFEEGMRVAQSEAQKSQALLQTKEVEISHAKRYMETQDAQMLEKEVLLRKERDRATLAERKAEHLSEVVAAKELEIANLTEKVADAETLLQQEREMHDQTREAVAAAEEELRRMNTEADAMRKQIDTQKASTAAAQQQIAALENLTAEFEVLAGEAHAEEVALEKYKAAMEERRKRALALLEAAENSALNVLSQLEKNGPGAQGAMSEIAQQVEALKQAREAEVALHEEEHKRAVAAQQRLEQERQQLQQELASVRQQLQQDLASVKQHLQQEAAHRKAVAKRLALTACTYGRQGTSEICRELRAMRIGTPLEIIGKAPRRPELRYFKMFKSGVVMWTDDLSGKKSFKKSDHFVAGAIIGIDFGKCSSAYLYGLEQQKGVNGSATTTQAPVAPWRCFTVRTQTDTYEFRAKSDEAAQDWVVGLGRLSATHCAPTVTNRHELIVHRVRMKLTAYANQRGVRLAVVWKEAIDKTFGKNPPTRGQAKPERLPASGSPPQAKQSNSHRQEQSSPSQQQQQGESRSRRTSGGAERGRGGSRHRGASESPQAAKDHHQPRESPESAAKGSSPKSPEPSEPKKHRRHTQQTPEERRKSSHSASKQERKAAEAQASPNSSPTPGREEGGQQPQRSSRGKATRNRKEEPKGDAAAAGEAKPSSGKPRPPYFSRDETKQHIAPQRLLLVLVALFRALDSGRKRFKAPGAYTEREIEREGNREHVHAASAWRIREAQRVRGKTECALVMKGAEREAVVVA
ncbi:plectin [Cyclospora cayetanensis]|uniref:Plectin n=1 Tax=Cyclospora cayetanensis TaxID=88456 RepID=A0A6P6RZN3_9EIME|nr:plectin [Cyclospora cayetanensis]